MRNPFRYFNSSPEVIRLTVMMYVRYPLSLRQVDRSPGAFPGFSLFTAFGRAAPLNLELQRDCRVLPFPFHFLDNNQAMNVCPRHYDWPEFYDHLVDLTGYAFSWPLIYRRLRSNRTPIPKWLNVVRAISSEKFGRLKYHSTIRRLLDTDSAVRQFFDGETKVLPRFYQERIRKDLGALWDMLPSGALFHDHSAYLKAHEAQTARVPARGVA
jgi:hypothetical protein